MAAATIYRCFAPDVGQRVPHELHGAALPSGAELLGGRRLEAFLRVRDDELHAPQAAPRQRTKELGPERLRLRRAHRHPSTSRRPLVFTRNRYYHGNGHDPPGFAHLHVGGVDPQVAQQPSIGRSRKACTHSSSISVHRRDTWLLEIPVIPIAFTRSSTERVETPCT